MTQESESAGYSIAPLRWIYTVAAGFALQQSVQTLVGGDAGRIHPLTFDFLIFLVFVTFLVRFAHGALRHFDDVYSRRAVPGGYKPLIDFVDLFAEAVLFILLSFSLRNHVLFSVYLLVLLAIDSFWIWRTCDLPITTPFRNWLMANVLFAAIVGLVILCQGDHDRWLVGSVAGAGLLHGALDYVLPGNWKFYFGARSEPPEPIRTISQCVDGPLDLIWRVSTAPVNGLLRRDTRHAGGNDHGSQAMAQNEGRPLVYLASPLGFAESTRLYLGELTESLSEAGCDVFDPWSQPQGQLIRNALAIRESEKRLIDLRAANRAVAEANENGLRRCDCVLAVLDGVDVDSGTAAEVGFAHAIGKKILGLRTDFRRVGDNDATVINLQLQYWIEANGGEIFSDILEAQGALRSGLA